MFMMPSRFSSAYVQVCFSTCTKLVSSVTEWACGHAAESPVKEIPCQILATRTKTWPYLATRNWKKAELVHCSSVDSAERETQSCGSIWTWEAPTCWCAAFSMARRKLRLLILFHRSYSALLPGRCGNWAATVKRNHCLIAAPGCLRRHGCNQASRVVGKLFLWWALPQSRFLLF